MASHFPPASSSFWAVKNVQEIFLTLLQGIESTRECNLLERIFFGLIFHAPKETDYLENSLFPSFSQSYPCEWMGVEATRRWWWWTTRKHCGCFKVITNRRETHRTTVFHSFNSHFYLIFIISYFLHSLAVCRQYCLENTQILHCMDILI